jgi:hypothetical protein
VTVAANGTERRSLLELSIGKPGCFRTANPCHQRNIMLNMNM